MKLPISVIVVWFIIITYINVACHNSSSNENNNDTINNDTIENLQIIPIDTISYINTIDSLQNVINDIQLDIDKYQQHTDSIAAELVVAQYKLARIDYYVSISKGTNLKYLRGWILRVLKD